MFLFCLMHSDLEKLSWDLMYHAYIWKTCNNYGFFWSDTLLLAIRLGSSISLGCCTLVAGIAQRICWNQVDIFLSQIVKSRCSGPLFQKLLICPRLPSSSPLLSSSGQRHILMRQWWQNFKINELLLLLGSWVSHWICATDASKWPRSIWWPVSQMTPPNIWLSLLRYGSLLPQKMKHPILFKSWAKSVTDLMRCETGGDGEAPTASREKLPQIAMALVAFYFPKKCPCCNLFLKIRISCIKVMPVPSTFKIALFYMLFLKLR